MQYHHQVSGLSNVKSYVVGKVIEAHILAWYKAKYNIVVVRTDWHNDMRYQATYGNYDLDCKCGYGVSYIEAVLDLNDGEMPNELDRVM